MNSFFAFTRGEITESTNKPNIVNMDKEKRKKKERKEKEKKKTKRYSQSALGSRQKEWRRQSGGFRQT